MGKYVLLMVFAAALSLAYFSQQSHRSAQAANEDQVERQKVVLARQIARSAFNEGISRVKRGVGKSLESEGLEDEKYQVGEFDEGGEFDLTFSNIKTEIKDKVNWRLADVMAEGRFPVEEPQTIYRIEATARQAIKEEVNAMTIGESIGFTINGPGCKECINGNDDAGGKPQLGISLPQGGDSDAVCDKFKNGGGGKGKGGKGKGGTPIVGVGEGCSVETRSEDRDDEVDRVMEAIGETIRESSSSKIEVYDGENVENSTSPESPGILYVEDGKKAKISNDWYGLVFVSKSERSDSDDEDSKRGQVTLDGKHSIKGALLMQEGSKFRLNGGGTGDNIDYNTSRLLALVDVLPMLGDPVRITDRCGGVVQSDGRLEACD
jgi:hypothetical protein